MSAPPPSSTIGRPPHVKPADRLRPRRPAPPPRASDKSRPAAARAGASGTELRQAMSHFATGVTVVTSITAEGLPLGSTANAVSSVSLDPPLVLICLRSQSETLAALLTHHRFAINVLAEDQLAHAQSFAKPSTPEIWAEVGHRRSRHDLPLLEGAAASLQCALYDDFDCGDHKIVIGRVLEVEQPRQAADPLIFHRGTFARLSQAEWQPRSAREEADLADVLIPTPDGDLRLLPVEHEQGSSLTSAIVIVGEPQSTDRTLVYLHTGCLLGDSLGHLHCRRRAAFRQALAAMRTRGSGVLVYHRDDSAPFADCCASSAPDSAKAKAVDAEAQRALAAALGALSLGPVRLLVNASVGGGLSYSELGLEVVGVERLPTLIDQERA